MGGLTVAEYIKREALIKKLRIMPIPKQAGSANTWLDNCAAGVNAAIREVASFPAADVAPVVRCKGCKHFKNYGKTSLLMDGKNIKAGWCHRRARYDEEYRMPPDGFCSYGEPKMDGGTDHASG